MPALPTGVALIAMLLVGPLISLAIALEAWKLLVLLLLVAGVPVLIRWPVIVAFGLYAVVVPFDLVAAVESAGGATVSKLLGVVASGVLLAVGVTERRLVRPPATAVCLGLFVFWGILSTSWSVNADISQGRIVTSISFLLLYVVAVSFRVTPKELRAVVFLTILGGILAASVPLILGEDALTKSGRSTLTLEQQRANINYFAVSLIAPLLLAIGRFLGDRRWAAKALALAAMAVIVTALYTTASRGATLAVALGLGLLVVLSRRIGQGIVVAAVCGLLLAFMSSDVLVTRIETVVEGSDTTGTGRLRIWRVALSALEQYWVFGSGLSTFQHVYYMIASVPPSKGGAPASHNLYLGTWVELGIVGLLLLLLTFALHFRAAFKARWHSIDQITTTAACFALFVVAFFGDFQYQKTFWLPWMLLMWVAQRRAEEPQRRLQYVERVAVGRPVQLRNGS